MWLNGGVLLLGIISAIALLCWTTRIVREKVGSAMSTLDFILWESELATPIYDQLVFELGDPLD